MPSKARCRTVCTYSVDKCKVFRPKQKCFAIEKESRFELITCATKIAVFCNQRRCHRKHFAKHVRNQLSNVKLFTHLKRRIVVWNTNFKL